MLARNRSIKPQSSREVGQSGSTHLGSIAWVLALVACSTVSPAEELRCRPALAAPAPPSHALIRAEVDPVIGAYILVIPGFERPAVAEQLAQQCGVTLLDKVESLNAHVKSLPYSALNYVAALEGVRFLEPAIPKLDSRNDRNRMEVQAESDFWVPKKTFCIAGSPTLGSPNIAP